MSAADASTPSHPLTSMLQSADLARAYALCVFGAVLGAHLIESLAGAVTLGSIVAGLCLLGVAILIARRREISPARLAPVTLLAFLAWALVSSTWSVDPAASFLHWLPLAGVAIMAVTLGHIRDTLQTVRALGDACRVALAGSLVLEIVSGILLDMPLRFLGIQGRLAELGPVQGVFGTRNMLGFVAVIALVTFAIELRTQSVRRGTATFSIVLATVLALLSASPMVYVLAAAVLLAAGMLWLVRAAPRERRGTMQWTLAAVVVTGSLTVALLRSRILALLGAQDDLALRTDLWSLMDYYIRLRPVQGWGWFGAWDAGTPPFGIINVMLGQQHTTALNAYIDTLLQLGWFGFVLLAALLAMALVRAWLVAADRRSIVYAWTPLVLVTLTVTSLFESFPLFGTGWLILVLCAVRAGQSRSWRDLAGPRPPTGTLPAAS